MTTHTENTSENTSNIYNIYPSINNKSLTEDGSDGLEAYTLQEIEEQLDFSKLYAYAEKNPEKVGKQDVDSLLYILYDLFNTRKPIKVAGEEKPSQVVISKISKLSWRHLCYAICQYKSQKTRIKHQTAYMVTVLYKALEQMHNDQLNQLSLETADGSESKPVQKKPSKNNFHNFPERDYTRKQTKDLERILRGYAKE
ncbi:phage protein [Roseburia sp. CAG:309]|nr:phage protein [Roseburia sp. CAG:309]